MIALSRLALIAACGTAILTSPRSALAKVEILDEERILLSGTIQRKDIEQIASALANYPPPKKLIVAAWGSGDTAWEAVHEMSKLLEEREVTVEIKYAEDAAIAIAGRKTIYTGTMIAHNPVKVSSTRDRTIRIWEYVQTPNGTQQRERTETESLAPTLDRFNMTCQGRMPSAAADLGNEPNEIVGREDDHVNRKGIRDSHKHIWFYKRSGRTGKWSHDEPTEVLEIISSARKKTNQRLDTLRRTAEKNRQKKKRRSNP